MSLIDLAEHGRLPDPLIRLGIRRLCRQRLVDDFADDPVTQHERLMARVQELRESPIAIHTDAANEQHYEVPADFFRFSLGKHLKYSSCYWQPGVTDLDVAEADMLALSSERAELEDGQRVLELGCGWGSLTLWMAAHYPNSQITAVSNSNSQREFIEARAAKRGLENLRVVTCDVNELKLEDRFDRVVSVEMFEHMRNYRRLLGNIASWLKPGGKLFVHIFCHRELLYPFETEGENNWMGRYFFTGGLMPSADTLLYFQEDLRIEEQWRMSGVHYEKTANAWLALTDQNRDRILPVMAETYGEDQAEVWLQRWRMFYMACAELFGFDGGREWLVAHYRFVRP
ncbi:MAG: cyclopropane-fatty-acyl-phospholipid synthase family protein [Pseudomonadota bacterium]